MAKLTAVQDDFQKFFMAFLEKKCAEQANSKIKPTRFKKGKKVVSKS